MYATITTAKLIAVATLSWTQVQAAGATTGEAVTRSRFAAFVQEHGRSYELGSAEYATRLAHFQERLARVEAHNGRGDRSWTAAVNALADQTPEELAMLRGYRPSAPRGTGGRPMASFLDASVHHVVNVSHLPKSFTWHGQLQATLQKHVKDQGGCGSCWAISSAAVLRAHAELYQTDRTFSTQQMVECTPNPQKCGGAGGCAGATAELAMDYVAKKGLLTEEEHRYTGQGTRCPVKLVLKIPVASAAKDAAFLSMPAQKDHEVLNGGLSFGMSGWEKLPENKAEPLLLALYERGPVVISVGANDAWSMYSSGIVQPAAKESVLNHAVMLIGYGYGEHESMGFWQIQNSWGPDWGENGTIRMLRRDAKDEDAYCGWDTRPLDGTACASGPEKTPEKVWVCGSFGMLYDSVVPTFTLSEAGFLSRHRRDTTGIFTQLDSHKRKHDL